MSRAVDPRRRCVPMLEWPEGILVPWQAGLAPRGRFSQQGPATHLSDKSVEKYADGLGRFLGHRTWRGLPLPDWDLGDHVTPEAVAAYIDDLTALGNSDYTIVGRLQELVGAFRILDPEGDYRWITWPGGVPVRRKLAMRRRAITVHHPRRLYRWGFRLMKKALTLRGPQRRRVMLRDGLLIASQAARALRMRSTLALRLGTSFRRRDGGWWIELDEIDVKTGRPIAFHAPRGLSAWIDRYVTVERVELLQGKVHDALWIGWDGEPMQEAGIDKRVRWWSAKEFGPKEAFGVHRFRYGIATHGPMEDPEHPGISAAILNITPDVDGKHYNRGKRAAAAMRFLKGLHDERRETEGLAGRHFDARLAAKGLKRVGKKGHEPA